MEVEKVLENIRKFRELKGYSRDHLAEELEITRSGYGKLERGESELTLQRLEQIAIILEVSIPELFSFDASNIFSVSSPQFADYGTIGISTHNAKDDIILKYVEQLEAKIKDLENKDNL